jgi:hypothetical protein
VTSGDVTSANVTDVTSGHFRYLLIAPPQMLTELYSYTTEVGSIPLTQNYMLAQFTVFILTYIRMIF